MKVKSSITYLFVLLFNFILIFSSVLPTLGQTVLGVYEFNGDPRYYTASYAIKSQPAYATFSDFARVNVTSVVGENYFNSRSWSAPYSDTKYIEFTITAKPGYKLNLEKIYFEQLRSNTGPTYFRVAHNGTGSFVTVSPDFASSTVAATGLHGKPFTWDFPDFTSAWGSSVTFRIYAYGASGGTGAFRVDNVTLYGTQIPDVRINEFHYYNTAQTKNSFVELLVPKEYTQLGEVGLTLYNAEGQVYYTDQLHHCKNKPDADAGSDKIYYLDIPDGMTNQGGISVSLPGKVLQFISYGGSFKAINGPAVGLNSQDVGITETAADGTQTALYLPRVFSAAASFSQTSTSNTDWTKYEDNYNTKGYPNDYVVTLPVDLIYFKANITSQGVALQWKTGFEEENSFFAVEKSADAVHFENIGEVKGQGTTAGNTTYTFLDKNIHGTAYYRLKQVDRDGTFTYSPVKSVTHHVTKATIRAYPNPVTDYIQVELGAGISPAVMQLMDLQGRLLLIQDIHSVSNHTLDVSRLPAGQYILRVLQNNQKWSQQFLKQ